MHGVCDIGRCMKDIQLSLALVRRLMERKTTIALIFIKVHRFLQVKDHAAQGGMINEASPNFPAFMERLLRDLQFSRRFRGSEEILKGLFLKDLI